MSTPEIQLVAKFNRLFDLLAWFTGTRVMLHLPTQNGYLRHMRGWSDGDKLICTMPMGVHGHAIASLPLVANDDVSDDDLAVIRTFADGFAGNKPAFAEEFEPQGRA